MRVLMKNDDFEQHTTAERILPPRDSRRDPGFYSGFRESREQNAWCAGRREGVVGGNGGERIR